MSSPAKDTAQTPKATDLEARFFFIILTNVKGALPVDWDAVAAQAGYNSGGVARVRFGQIKRRLSAATASPSVPKVAKRCVKAPPVAGKRTKRAKVSDVMDDDDDDILFDDDQKVKVKEDEDDILKDEDEI